MKIIVIVLVLLSIGLSSCLKDKSTEPITIVPGPCSDTVSFSSFVMPEIIDASCNSMGCHDQAAAGGYIFLNHDQISTNATAIFSAINHEAGFVPMPFYQNKISDTLIQKFDCWMQQGLLNN